MEPLGITGNWTLEASRLPQAWNWRETIQRSGNVESVRTGVVDDGFEQHDDLLETRSIEILCKSTPDGQNAHRMFQAVTASLLQE